MDFRKMVLKETGIVAIGEVIGVAAMYGIFALLGKFDSAVLIGGLVGGVGRFESLALRWRNTPCRS